MISMIVLNRNVISLRKGIVKICLNAHLWCQTEDAETAAFKLACIVLVLITQQPLDAEIPTFDPDASRV